jgi:hypothetical protein
MAPFQQVHDLSQNQSWNSRLTWDQQGANGMHATRECSNWFFAEKPQRNRLWAMRNIIAALALLLCLSNMPALAQSIFTTQIGNRPAVVVSGEIAPNAAEVFQAAAGQLQAPLIFLSRPGGSFGNWPLYPNASTGNRGGRTAESLLCLGADLAGWGQALHGSECPHWISRRLPDEKRPR